MNTPCEFVKSDGEPCQAKCMTNSDYCYWHNPDMAASRGEARKKGGQNRRAGKQSNHGRYSIKTTGEVLRALEDALNDACNLENSHTRARTIGLKENTISKGFSLICNFWSSILSFNFRLS